MSGTYSKREVTYYSVPQAILRTRALHGDTTWPSLPRVCTLCYVIMRKRTMGIVQSLIDSFNHKNDSQLGNTNNNEPKSKNAAKVDEYEDVELIQMKMAIVNDPNSFILNNLMMCIQFFENYEE